MFFNSPRVDSIFSRENWFSPSADLSFATQEFSSVTVLSRSTHSLTRSEGLERPSPAAFSAPTNQGVNSLIPVLYSAQNLTSLEYLSHSILVLAWSSVTYLVILASSSLKT